MLFHHQQPIRCTSDGPLDQMKFPVQRSNPHPTLLQSEVDWVRRANEGVYENGDLKKIFVELRQFQSLFKLSPYLMGGRSLDTFNATVGAYERLLLRFAPKLLSTIESGEGLVESLTPLFDFDLPVYCNDDADIVLFAVCGLDVSLLGQGAGQSFIATPIRRFVEAVRLLELEVDDVVADLGGVGLLCGLGTHISPCRWVNVELDKRLHQTAERLTPWLGLDGRAVAIRANFLVGFPFAANKFYCYEPVDPEDVNKLIDCFATHSAEEEITIATFVQPNMHTSLPDGLRARPDRFFVHAASEEGDITVFKTR